MARFLSGRCHGDLDGRRPLLFAGGVVEVGTGRGALRGAWDSTDEVDDDVAGLVGLEASQVQHDRSVGQLPRGDRPGLLQVVEDLRIDVEAGGSVILSLFSRTADSLKTGRWRLTLKAGKTELGALPFTIGP